MHHLETIFEPDFFRTNRKKLLQACDNAVVVIPGAGLLQKSTDTTYPFRQASSFWYLTGCVEPNAVLVVTETTSFIIIPKPHSSYEAFEGVVNVEQIAKTSGVNKVVYEKEGYQELQQLITVAKSIYTLPKQPSFYPQIGMFTNPFRTKIYAKLKRMAGSIEMKSCAEMIARLRMYKTTQEVACIQTAFDKTVGALLQTEAALHGVASERDIAAVLSKSFIDNGVEHAYPPIVASGKNSLVLHYEKNNAPIKKEEVILIDVGAEFGGYCADVTRTYALNAVTPFMQEVYDAVQAWQQQGFSILQSAPTRREYETQMRQIGKEQLIALGYKKAAKDHEFDYMPHASGHFLGLDVHDTGLDDEPMDDGVVYMVEPGLYFPDKGFGIRLEDPAHCTNGQVKRLTETLPYRFVI